MIFAWQQLTCMRIVPIATVFHVLIAVQWLLFLVKLLKITYYKLYIDQRQNLTNGFWAKDFRRERNVS